MVAKGGEGPEEEAKSSAIYDSDEVEDSEDQAARIERQRMFADLKTRAPEEIKTHACQTAAVEVSEAPRGRKDFCRALLPSLSLPLESGSPFRGPSVVARQAELQCSSSSLHRVLCVPLQLRVEPFN